jgi:hypothetical protein
MPPSTAWRVTPAGLPVSPHDDVIMHRNPSGFATASIYRVMSMSARRSRVAGRMIVHEDHRRRGQFEKLDRGVRRKFSRTSSQPVRRNVRADSGHV